MIDRLELAHIERALTLAIPFVKRARAANPPVDPMVGSEEDNVLAYIRIALKIVQMIPIAVPLHAESTVNKALVEAAKILINFRGEGERTKLEEWQACYAMIFRQMNDLVNAPKPEDRRLSIAKEALEKLARLGNGDHYGNSIGNEIAKEALSQMIGRIGGNARSVPPRDYCYPPVASFTIIDTYKRANGEIIYIVQNDVARDRHDNGLIGKPVLIDGKMFTVRGVECNSINVIPANARIGLLV